MPRAWPAGVQHSLGKLQASFKRTWASTGHRGRVDARGVRSGGAPGLTRTSDRSAGAPSRDGRSAAPAALRGLTFPDEEAVVSRAAERRDGAGVVPRRSRKGATAGWPKVRVRPGAGCRRWPRASTRPRWAVDANPLKMAPHLSLRMCAGSLPCAGVVTRGTLRSEVQEEARRRPPGDMSGEESAESPRLP